MGNGATANSATPVAVSGGLTFVTLVAGGLDACGLTPNGAAYCWGHNFYGEVGDGTFDHRSVPTRVAGGLRFRTIAIGNSHACGVLLTNSADSSAAYCWGTNGDGELGDGGTTSSAAPVAVRWP